MKKNFISTLLLLLFLGGGCYLFQDDATLLGHSLSWGARRLNWLGGEELVINYKPRSGIAGPYSIEIRTTAPIGTPPNYIGTGLYVNAHYVTGKDTQRGSTTALHRSYVDVPKRLFVVKTNAAAQVVLRRNGDRIEVVELR